MKARKGRNWWVYVHHVVDADLYYPGMTNNPSLRFRNCCYTSTVLAKYLDPSVPLKKNKNIETLLLHVNGEEFARKLEDMLILKYRSIGKCLNYRRGDIFNKDTRREADRVRQSERRANNPEHFKELSKKRYQRNPQKFIELSKKIRSTPEGKIYYRVTNFNRSHPDRAIETPLEAKQKYLEWGYIPDYIKSDDLI